MSAPTPADARTAVVDAARRMNASGLNRARAGNVSARVAGGEAFLVTPTGMDYDAIDADDIVEVGFDGSARGRRAPSSEWRFHRAIYEARGDAFAIVHAHAPFCTTLACLRRGIPAFHYMVAVAGGADIRCSDYATFGTDELAEAMCLALEDRRACLMANHGMVAFGRDLDHALRLAIEVESLAEMYWRALQVGEPVLLPAEEMARVIGKFASYGQPRT